ncbi:hypothetical protein HANVADRAFT_51615, partial [Hanseniaspora valbyensis NRRL Y-1626]
MAKITFTDELLNQPLPEPIYKKDILSNKKLEEDDDEAPPTASSFKQSEQDFESIQRKQELFNKKQQKLAKKNKNLQQLRNKKQKEQSKQQEKENEETENIEDKNIKEKISIDKLKAFEQQLISMQQKTERNRRLGKNGAEEEEELEELDMDFLESISDDTKSNSKSQSISSVKPKKTIFKDEENIQQNLPKQAKYDNKRDDYIQQESIKQTNKVSKLRALRDAKNKTQRIKQNDILIEKLSATKTSSTNAGRQTMKNTKLSKLRNKLL